MTTRELPKRANRGNKLSRLINDALDDDQDDEFWGKGGVGAELFKEEANDAEFDEEKAKVTAKEDTGEDSADSDIDEVETKPEQQQEENKQVEEPKVTKKRKRNVYKDPALAKKKAKKAPTTDEETQPLGITQEAETTEKRTKTKSDKKEKMKLRATTVQYTQERRKIREVAAKQQARKKRKPKKKIKNLTQAEILAEAKKTEPVNLKSLEEMLRIEEENKKPVSKKYTVEGPITRYHSFAGRNTITFDVDEVPKFLNSKAPAYPNQPTCEITGLPAKYIDPRTKISYATIDAYKAIQKRFCQDIPPSANSNTNDKNEADSPRIILVERKPEEESENAPKLPIIKLQIKRPLKTS